MRHKKLPTKVLRALDGQKTYIEGLYRTGYAVEPLFAELTKRIGEAIADDLPF